MALNLKFSVLCVTLSSITRLFYKINRSKILFWANSKKKIIDIDPNFSLRRDLDFHNLSKVWAHLRSRSLWVSRVTGLTFDRQSKGRWSWKTSVTAYLLSNTNRRLSFSFSLDYVFTYRWHTLTTLSLSIWKSTFGEGFLYLRGLFIIFLIDALLTDDEPLWEPVEWSLVQSWIMFIFLFAWIAENLISSRYGSYTGRDKRVWFSWYKTFWLIEGWYIMSLGLASLWVMVPHYYEVTYSVSFIHSWWHWYSRVFFFKFLSVYTVVLFLAYYLQISMRWVNWKKPFVLIILINFFLSYLLYAHFFFSFFGYFTDANWCRKTRLVDYVQLSHEPFKWSWGPSNRDHFIYHQSKTVFWFKSDGPFAGAFLFYNLFFFLALFTLLIYWVALVRRVYATQEVTFTFTTYCISALKQFFYFFALIFLLVTLSFFFTYWRLPIEFYWSLNAHSWLYNFALIIWDYPTFLLSLFL